MASALYNKVQILLNDVLSIIAEVEQKMKGLDDENANLLEEVDDLYRQLDDERNQNDYAPE